MKTKSNMTVSKDTWQLNRFPNDNWTQVEIFQKAMGRLPMEKGDKLTQEVLDIFCEKYEKGEIKTTTTSLEDIYEAIKAGEVKISE